MAVSFGIDPAKVPSISGLEASLLAARTNAAKSLTAGSTPSMADPAAPPRYNSDSMLGDLGRSTSMSDFGFGVNYAGAGGLFGNTPAATQPAAAPTREQPAQPTAPATPMPAATASQTAQQYQFPSLSQWNTGNSTPAVNLSQWLNPTVPTQTAAPPPAPAPAPATQTYGLDPSSYSAMRSQFGGATGGLFDQAMAKSAGMANNGVAEAVDRFAQNNPNTFLGTIDIRDEYGNRLAPSTSGEPMTIHPSAFGQYSNIGLAAASGTPTEAGLDPRYRKLMVDTPSVVSSGQGANAGYPTPKPTTPPPGATAPRPGVNIANNTPTGPIPASANYAGVPVSQVQNIPMGGTAMVTTGPAGPSNARDYEASGFYVYGPNGQRITGTIPPNVVISLYRFSPGPGTMVNTGPRGGAAGGPPAGYSYEPGKGTEKPSRLGY